MQIIHHRVNNISQLENIPLNHGIELDVRYHEDQLILCHDPFNHNKNKETKLNELMSKWKCKGPIILNLKSEGIEDACIKIMKKYNVNNWFFLDMSIPFLVNYSDKVYKKQIKDLSQDNLAIRFSDKEPLEFALSFKGKIKWVWIDYFSRFPLTKDTFLKLKGAKFKVCLVSPDIKSKSIISSQQLIELCKNFEIDAVCTKDPNIWRNF